MKKPWKCVFVLLVLSVLGGCATFNYGSNLTSVKGQNGTIIEGKDNSFEDDLVRVGCSEKYGWLLLTLQNKSDNSVQIPWDDISYVDETGQSHRVIRGETIIATRGMPQPPLTVPSKATVSEQIAPQDHFFFSTLSTSWECTHLFPEGSVGKTARLVLPVVTPNGKVEYDLTLAIVDEDESKP